MTISDLFLKDPMMISKALKVDKSNVFQSKSYLREIYDDFDEEIKNKASDYGFITNE